MFAPLAIGGALTSRDWFNGSLGPIVRKRKPRTSRMPPRKKRAKIGTPCALGLVTTPNSSLRRNTKPEPGEPLPPPR